MSTRSPLPLRPIEAVLRRPRIARDGYRVFACGESGSGKSTLAYRSVIRDVVRDGRIALVYDADGSSSDALTNGCAWRQRLARDLVAEVRSVSDARDALKRSGVFGWFRRSPIRVLVVPALKFSSPRDARALWLELADSDSRARGWALLADEADEIFPLSLPQTGPTQRVLRAVRNRSQVLYATSNYPQSTAPRLRQLAQHACVFRGATARYVKACEWFGESQWFEDALSLKQFEFLYRRSGEGAPLPTLHALGSKLPW